MYVRIYIPHTTWATNKQADGTFGRTSARAHFLVYAFLSIMIFLHVCRICICERHTMCAFQLPFVSQTTWLYPLPSLFFPYFHHFLASSAQNTVLHSKTSPTRS